MTLILSELLNFPFLRDQLFISFFKSLSPDSQISYDKFIFNAQLEYYCKFINPHFDPKSLESSSSISSKCPFASKIPPTGNIYFAIEPLSRVRYSFIENVHISDMNLAGLTVGIVKPDREACRGCPFNIFTSGCHKFINFEQLQQSQTSINIVVSDASFSDSLPVHNMPIFNELVTIMPFLSASDVFYFFPNNTLIINPHDIDKTLNILVYLYLSNLTEISLETLKAAGIGCKGIQPSQFEAYNDVISLEYIRNNRALFS